MFRVFFFIILQALAGNDFADADVNTVYIVPSSSHQEYTTLKLHH
jgi:hypothetical protein